MSRAENNPQRSTAEEMDYPAMARWILADLRHRKYLANLDSPPESRAVYAYWAWRGSIEHEDAMANWDKVEKLYQEIQRQLNQ